MDRNATFASAIYGVPCQFTKGNNNANLYLRYQRTLKKENGRWVIYSGIVGIARSARTNQELEKLEGK